MKSTMTIKEQETINIEENDINSSTRKKRNWSSPGNDKITNFWVKKLTCTYKGLAKTFDTIVNYEIPLPQWLVTGKCVMIPKTDNPQAKDHRPITDLTRCLRQ